MIDHLSARALTARLGGDWHGRYGLVAAPGHGPQNRAVQVSDGRDGRVVVHCHNGDDWREVRLAFGLDGDQPRQRATTPMPVQPDPGAECTAARKLARARRMWETARELTAGDPVTLYLRGRHIQPPYRAALRYCPAAHDMESAAGTRPAMVALISHADGHAAGVHVTYLTTDGHKAVGLRSVKKMLGSVATAAVWPDAHVPRMAIAEGIESALAVEQLHGLPCIAALSANNLHRVVLPPVVRELLIVADREPSGTGVKAAQRAQAMYRRLGIRAFAGMPNVPAGHVKWDAADELARVTT